MMMMKILVALLCEVAVYNLCRAAVLEVVGRHGS